MNRCIDAIGAAPEALFAQMARPLRLEYAGALYHLTSRGNAQQDIFLDDADRRIFLRVLGETVTRPRLDALLPPEKLHEHVERNAAIQEAHRRHGYTLAEIARHTRLHYSTVSRIAATSMQQFKT